MKMYCLLLLSIIFVFDNNSLLFSQEAPSVDSALSVIQYLAADALEGRDTGTTGYEKAARWVAEKFTQWGLEPAGDKQTWFQEFPFRYYKADFNRPVLTIDGRDFHWDMGDFKVLRYSGGGTIKTDVVFVGYGISDPQGRLDEYENVNVKGKIVLVMRGCPYGDTERWKEVCTDSAKAAMAFSHEASGMLLCADFKSKKRDVGYWRLQPGNFKNKFLVFGVNGRVVQFLLRHRNERQYSFMRRMRRIQDRLDEKLEPISITPGKKIEMQAKVAYDPERTGKNVLAMIPGSDPDIGNEVVILGAHLDHLGIKYGDIYNGADDNASGVSVVLEIARMMSANHILPRRTILFACWGGEERGLLGSYHYCKYPVLPLENTVLNFNIDMVGIGEKLCLAGIYYTPEIWQRIKNHRTDKDLSFIVPERGEARGSDHAGFMKMGVPAFNLQTSPWEAHVNYHHPDDDSGTIDTKILERVIHFVYGNTLLLANHESRFICEDREAMYIHKSGVVVNPHPLPFQPGMAVLDSLEMEWIDVQFIEVQPEYCEEPHNKWLNVIKSLDLANRDEKNPTRLDFTVNHIFNSLREGIVPVIGITGAESVNSDLANLSIAAKIGVRFFTFNGYDGRWIDSKSGLTHEGRKAIRLLNEWNTMIVTRNLPVKIVEEIVDESWYPLLITGINDPSQLSDDLAFKVKTRGSLIAIDFSLNDTGEDFLHHLNAMRNKLPIQSLCVYPRLNSQSLVSKLDRLSRISIAMSNNGMPQDDIKKILGENFESLFRKILPL